MLILNDSLKISHGRTRVCYEHPEDQALVVKTAFAGDREGELSNERELQAYQNLVRLHKDVSCVSECHTIVETNRGKGLLCQCIRNSDGSIAKSIWDIILYQKDCDIDAIEAVISNFCVHLRSQDIFIFDINLKNIVLQQKDRGDYNPHIIDCKSQVENKEFIPLSKYSRYFARKKLARRTQQLTCRIREFYEKRDKLIEKVKKEKRQF